MMKKMTRRRRKKANPAVRIARRRKEKNIYSIYFSFLNFAESSAAEDCEDSDDLADNPEKFLIFTTGSKTYTPHQIGFKRIKPMNFPRRLDPGPSLRERLAQRERERERQNSGSPRPEPNWLDYDAVSDRFDKVDHLIDLHGHVIGMSLSPDHRFAYIFFFVVYFFISLRFFSDIKENKSFLLFIFQISLC